MLEYGLKDVHNLGNLEFDDAFLLEHLNFVTKLYKICIHEEREYYSEGPRSIK